MKTSHLLLMATSGILFPLAGAAKSVEIEIPGELDFYGKAELAMTHADTDLLNRVEEGTNLHSIFSRVGVKGSYPLSDDLKVVYTLEVEVNGYDDDDSKDQPFSARNTFMGLSSNSYGRLVFGRNDTRFKKSEGCVDLFKEREGNLKQIFAGQERFGDTATYISPSLKGLKLGATWILGDDAESQTSTTGEEYGDGFSFSATYGDTKLKKHSFYLAAAADKDVKGVDALRFVAQVDLGPVQLGGLVQHTEKESADKEGNGFMANIAVPFASNIAKLQYSYDNSEVMKHTLSGTNLYEKAEMISVGIDHNFSNTTTAYVSATYLDLETEDDTAVSLGLRHFF
jgi:predicted porin